MPALEHLDVDVAVLRGQRSIAEAYNTIVDQADGPVVLIHDDVELQDPQAVENWPRCSTNPTSPWWV